jgi:hypothetical protein
MPIPSLLKTILFDDIFFTIQTISRDQTTIPSNITIQILPPTTKGKRKIMVGEQNKQCVRYNTSELWFKDNPTGYFYHDKWILVHCKGMVI